jgi:hypothetical protein
VPEADILAGARTESPRAALRDPAASSEAVPASRFKTSTLKSNIKSDFQHLQITKDGNKHSRQQANHQQSLRQSNQEAETIAIQGSKVGTSIKRNRRVTRSFFKNPLDINDRLPAEAPKILGKQEIGNYEYDSRIDRDLMSPASPGKRNPDWGNNNDLVENPDGRHLVPELSPEYGGLPSQALQNKYYVDGSYNRDMHMQQPPMPQDKISVYFQNLPV